QVGPVQVPTSVMSPVPPAGVKHPSALPLASTPAAAWPAPQFVPLAARAVAVEAFPVTAPVNGPLNVPLVVPGKVGLVGIDRIGLPATPSPLVTVTWLAVPIMLRLTVVGGGEVR